MTQRLTVALENSTGNTKNYDTVNRWILFILGLRKEGSKERDTQEPRKGVLEEGLG